MEATGSELTLVTGIASMGLGFVGCVAIFALDSTSSLAVGAVLVAIALGIVAVIRKGPGHEYGIVGLAVGLIGIASYVSGVTINSIV